MSKDCLFPTLQTRKNRTLMLKNANNHKRNALSKCPTFLELCIKYVQQQQNHPKLQLFRLLLMATGLPLSSFRLVELLQRKISLGHFYETVEENMTLLFGTIVGYNLKER